MSYQRTVLTDNDKNELYGYLQDAKDLKGLRKGLYIVMMRYLQHMSGSLHGIDNELDQDFFYDFANLLEVLLILSPEPLDQELTHFK
jgi:hypothetical protein